MILEWIRFGLTAAYLLFAVFTFASAVIGVSRFGFVMNRLHAAGIGDTLGIFAIAAGLVIATGLKMEALKLVLLVFFLWFTSPVSTHFVGQVEYFTNKKLDEHVKFKGEADCGTDTDRDH